MLRDCIFVLKVLSIFLLIQFYFCSTSFAIPETINVKLFEARRAVPYVYLKGPAQLVYPNSIDLNGATVVTKIKAEGSNVALYTVSSSGSRLLIKSRQFVLYEKNVRGIAIKFPGRSILSYRGEIKIKSQNSCLSVSNKVSTREFVYAVVASELPSNFLPEAKKALAVLTLTRLEFLPDERAIGDSTKSELYTGCSRVTQIDKANIDLVWKKRLYYKNKLVLPYYHSTCAGSTSPGKEFFKGNGEDLTYLSSVFCRYCKNSPFFDYKIRRVSRKKVTTLFGKVLPIVLKRDKAGRPIWLKTVSSQEPVSGYTAWIKLGRGLGWGTIPGTRFYLKELNENGKPLVEIRSNGAGHGVGLCQWGAQGLASKGYSFDKIIKHYYKLCETK